MNIFYINIDEFKNTHDKDFLLQYADREFKSEKRFFEYTIGRYLINNVAQKIYKIDNAKIVTETNGKPKFAHSDLHFSLSHSKNYAVACFDENECGIDIEFIKERDFKKLSQHYEQNFKNAGEFYKFWTLKEASYKQNSAVNDYCTTIFKENYYLTITSEKVFDKSIEIIKIK